MHDYMLHNVLNKIKDIIGIKQFDNTNIFTDTYQKLPNDIALKNIATLITYVIKDDDKFH